MRLVDEILRRFGSHPAFAGISLHLATPSPLWWGSLDVDYGDYTLILFEKETGIKVPVPPSDPERFSKRYEWLMKNAKERWIEWRCRKVYENLMEIARRVRERRKDLRLVLAVYPPVGYCGRTPDDAVAWLKFGRLVREYNRVVNGLDLAMFKNVEGVVLLKTLWPADYRFCKCFGDKPPRLLLSREVNFDPSVARWFHKPGACGINLHNRYFETAYGRKHPLKCLWWGPIGWRASAVLPEGRNFLELFAHGLSELDATILVTGGFTVGMVGREEVVREFASVFRRLPAVGWRNLPFLSDPVRGREWEDGEKHLLYFVNRLPYPLEVVLRFDRSAKLLPMGSGEGVKAEGGEARLRLLPFQLRAFRVEPREARLTNGEVVPPASLVDELRSRFERLKALLGEVKGADEDIKEALSEAETALRSGKLFRARLLLYGYESARLEALAEGIQGSNLSSGR